MGRGKPGDTSLPCDLDAEKKVLGAMIRDPDAIPRARDILAPSDFYQPSHQILYETMLEIDRSGWPVDLLILANALTRKNLMNEAGGPFYLAELVGCVATSVNVEYHARLVLDKAVRRRIIRQCAEISAAARTPGSCPGLCSRHRASARRADSRAESLAARSESAVTANSSLASSAAVAPRTARVRSIHS